LIFSIDDTDDNMPKTIDDVYIQRKVVEYIAAVLGPEQVFKQTYGLLASILRYCKKEVQQ